MDGLTLLGEARAAGLTVAAEGDKLVIRGPRRAEPIVRKLIDHKPEVMAVLVTGEARPHGPVGDDPVAWRDFYEERAAIREYSGHYQRHLAEQLAYGECIEAWCEQHPMSLRPGICAGCGKAPDTPWLDLADGARVCFPHGAGQFGCLMAHGLRRKERAIKALARLGLAPSPGWEA